MTVNGTPPRPKPPTMMDWPDLIKRRTAAAMSLTCNGIFLPLDQQPRAKLDKAQLQQRDNFIHARLVDDERRRERHMVARNSHDGTTRVNQEPAPARDACYLATDGPFFRERFPGFRIADEFDARQQALAAHIANEP